MNKVKKIAKQQLKNYKIYTGESTAWYNMYTCVQNLENTDK